MRYASRKFILALLALLFATWLCWYFRLTGTEYVTIVLGIIGMYKAANVLDGRAEAGK